MSTIQSPKIIAMCYSKVHPTQMIVFSLPTLPLAQAFQAEILAKCPSLACKILTKNN